MADGEFYLEAESEDARAFPPVFQRERYPRGTQVRVVPKRGPVMYVLYESTGECWRQVLVRAWPSRVRPGERVTR